MITLSVLAFVYFLPTIVAANRGHSVVGVLLLNLFFGWTGIGWIALLLWALLSFPGYRTYYAPVSYYYAPDQWRR